MPCRNIRRDKTGNVVQSGQVSRVVVAHVSYPACLGATVDDYEDIIWRTATGNTALHQSQKVRNLPPGAIGYIHGINNVCIAVSRLDVAAGTIEVCGGVGHVNAGVHIF